MESNIMVLKAILKMDFPEANIITFTNSVEACRSIELVGYDRIITDFMMPILTGENLIERARWSSINSHTPIAVCSAYGENEVISSLQTRYELVRSIPKPLDRTKLNKFIKEGKL